MGLEPVPEHEATYQLVSFDAGGRERLEAGGSYSEAVLRAAEADAPTDVFVFSHGWNGDVVAAREQYGRWVATMLDRTADRDLLAAAPGGFRPLLVGLHWPSKAWGEEEIGPASFAADTTAGGSGGDALVDRYTERLGGAPEVREAVRDVVEAARRDAAPRRLPATVREAFHVIDAATAAGATGDPAAPGEDREPFDPEQLYQGCLRADAVAFGGFSLGGILAPLRVLTFWTMKRRARTFGESGAADLLAELRVAAPDDARLHLMGHSFGCIVAVAAIAGAPAATGRRGPVSTLTLVQGAMSLWSMCSSIPAVPDRPGYFRKLVADHLVTGPTIVTTSVHDRAVGTFYPLGAWSGRQVDYAPGDEELPKYGGIGTHGVRGPDVRVADVELGGVDTRYPLIPGTVLNLDGSDVIKTSSGISGAHSDICHPEVAHAMWQAVAVTARAIRPT